MSVTPLENQSAGLDPGQLAVRGGHTGFHSFWQRMCAACRRVVKRASSLILEEKKKNIIIRLVTRIFVLSRNRVFFVRRRSFRTFVFLAHHRAELDGFLFRFFVVSGQRLKSRH